MTKYFVIIFMLFTIGIMSQEVPTDTFTYSKEKLTNVLSDIEKSFDVKFSFQDEHVKKHRITLIKNKYSLESILLELNELTGLFFKAIDDRYYAIYTKRKREDHTVVNQYINEIVINAYLTKGISKNTDNSFTIVPSKLAILPGLTEPDVLQTIQQLPGVISPNETATGLHVRGGTTDQNLLLWDGIKMYHSGHLFGMISGFNPNIEQKINFINKGTNPKYGDRVSSVIDIRTTDKIPEKTLVNAGINALNIDTYLSIPLWKDKMNIQLSGRRSYTDLYRTYTYNQYAEKVFQNTNLKYSDHKDDYFFYQDYTAKLNYYITENDLISFSSIFIGNDLNNTQIEKETENSFNDKLILKNMGYSLKWEKKWNDSFSHSTNVYYSKYEFSYQNLIKYPSTNFSLLNKKNQILDSGLGVEVNYKINDSYGVEAGYQLTANDVGHAYTSKTANLSFLLDADTSFIHTHSLYSLLKSKNIGMLSFEAGARLNHYSELNKSVIEPRFQLNLSLSEFLKLSFTGEIKHQTISQIKETVISDLGLENQIWILSDNEEFPIIKANHYSAGFLLKKNNWTLDFDSYYKKSSGLTTLTLGFLNPVDPNFHKGISNSKGFDVYLQKEYHDFRSWLTYSYNSTQNQFDEINDEKFFPSNSEIKHAVNLSFSYDFSKLQLALGWYWRTGKPYTVASISDAATSLNYDVLNGGRLPHYHRLDISAIYNFNSSKNKGIKGKLGFSVYNLYNHKTLLNREFKREETFDNTIQIRDRYSLGLTPSVFLRFSL